MFFPFALITSFNLLYNLHYLIVIAVRPTDIIDNAHYATLTCTATAGNQIFHFHFAFLLIIAELQPLHRSHASIQLSERDFLPRGPLPLTGEPGIAKYGVRPVQVEMHLCTRSFYSGNKSVTQSISWAASQLVSHPIVRPVNQSSSKGGQSARETTSQTVYQHAR